MQCRAAALKAALAVERYRVKYRNLPTSLDQLVPEFMDSMPLDPIDNQPIRFRRLERGYVTYSIGTDGVDDKGTERGKAGNFDTTIVVER